MPKTATGEALKKYIKDVLKGSTKAGEQAVEAGYPELSTYTKKYLSQLPDLSKYGDPQQRAALRRAGELYGDYRRAGEYDETDFSDLEKGYGKAGDYDKTKFEDFERQYGKAGDYDKTKFADFERMYGKAGDYDKTKFADLENKYGKAGDYQKTKFADIGGMYRSAGEYGPASFTTADYKTSNIKERMSPYEKLVSEQAQKRLKKSYDEARGEREAQAARAGAFGGSGAAIQEEVARRNYLEQSAQMNAQNLQNAYEAAVNLYGKEVADRLSSEQLGEASRQFSKQTELAGIEGLMSTREQEAAQIAAAKQAELAGLSGEMSARQMTASETAAAKQAELAGIAGAMGAREQEAAQVAAAKQAELAGIAGALGARQLTADQVAAAKQAELAGLAGQMGARQQTAAQVAAAKEAEFAGLQGQQESTRQQALLAEQRKNMQLTNLAALQQGGQYQQDYNLAQRMYPLDIYARQSAIMGGMSGGYNPLPTTNPKDPSMFQNIVAGVGAIGGLYNAFKRDGGLIYRGGGLAELEPEYYDQYER